MKQYQVNLNKGENMQVKFWFDVTCPWAYVTSRWYSKVANELNISTQWEIFSLSIKNRSNNKNYSDEMKAKHFKSLRVIRMIQAVKNNLDNKYVYKLYSEIGKQFHVDKNEIDKDLDKILSLCNIDESYLSYLDDEKLDEKIEQSTQNAVDVCGDDVGVPIIHLDDGENQNAIFGPIISEVPNLEDSIKLWEHFKYVCFNENVAELKRKRSIPLNPTVD